jgi:hypothetical protein
MLLHVPGAQYGDFLSENSIQSKVLRMRFVTEHSESAHCQVLGPHMLIFLQAGVSQTEMGL